MPLTIYTARLPRPEKGRRGYTGRDLLDVTRQAADAAALRGEPAPGAPFAPSRELLSWGLAECRAGRREASFPEYVERYLDEMRASWKRNRAAWVALASRGGVTLGCFCETAWLCHRTPLAKMLASVARGVLGIDAAECGERPGPMRALSLWQPWATYIVIGAKTIETRSWGTTYRGPVAIHAAKTKAGLPPTPEHAAVVPGAAELAYPLGVVVAVADLVDVLHVERHDPVYVDPSLLAVISGTRSWHVSRADVALGDLSIGRWAWRLANVRALRTPVALRGMQGLWEIDEATERAVMAQAEASRG